MSSLKDSSDITIHAFPPNDPSNPYNWSFSRKCLIITLGTLVVLNSTLASSLPSLASPQLARHFNVTDDLQLVLPNSVYLIGYVVGPVLWAPLSENYGRRWIIISTFWAFTGAMAGCAGANSWGMFVVMRFLSGLFGATPISLTGGLFADVLDDPMWRGRSIAWFMVVASAGPCFGPVPSGLLAEYSWRWPFLFGLILAPTSAFPLSFLPETFGPAILMSQAKHLRRQDPDANIYAPLELKHTTPRQLITQVLGRPIRMGITEPIVSAVCLYLSLIYGVIFMLFQAYGVIFPPIYNFTQGQTGLAFLPMVLGTLLALPLNFSYDTYIARAKSLQRPWSTLQESQRLPLALLGAPLIPLSLFWTGWTARASIHYIVPALGGLPFGLGFTLVFIGLINYIVDAYGVLSASALGATSMARSTCGVVLPFAARRMYRDLGIGWACSLLGFLSLVMCGIPVGFLRWGSLLRSRSPVCRELEGERRRGGEVGRGNVVVVSGGEDGGVAVEEKGSEQREEDVQREKG
ncbi:unnamed protein product [Zymoseptoria tritici ST99CH_3D7]|uniref:Major facilitator superfamily (MFS) profile domain-containing protein n=1 Tax=Zymoseptoria tritici (strain ST99CH_3D7) TaxID=1276538 RepID=A0A1X7S2V7_ZYMT9|nr:unnamed protein product [Zymoseptoria tritici ST99CH_3D7]